MNDLDLEQLIKEIEQSTASSITELEQYRIQYLGKKGKVKELFSRLRDADAEARKTLGAKLNDIKYKAEAKFESLKSKDRKSVV